MKPDTTTERAALLVWILFQRRNGISVNEAAELTGMNWHAAQDMLQRISRVIPLYEESPHGKTDVGIAHRPVRWCLLLPLADNDGG